MDNFLKLFKEIVNDELEKGEDTCLDDLEDWDSLAYVSFCVMADSEYSKRLRSIDLREAQTVQDLYDLLQRTAVHED